MTNPIQITFRNVQPSDALEHQIRKRVADLETFYPALVGCHVLVDLPHRHRHQGRPFHVRIELSVPGEDIVVSHEPTLHGALKDLGEPVRRKQADVNVLHKYAAVAVHEAFDLARRQLQDFARKQRGDVKVHLAPAHGRVVSLAVGDDYGFIESDDGRQLYFNAASVLGGGFARLEVGSRVTFTEEKGEKGPQASSVRTLGRHHYASI